MKIGYAISHYFVRQAAISMGSVLFNNDSSIVENVVVVGSKLSNDDKKLLHSVGEKYKRTVDFIDADEVFGDTYKQMELKGYGGFVAPWMFICPQIITESNPTDRLLMLDADTIIDGSLAELCDLDMDGKAIAAVISVNNYKRHITNPELQLLTRNQKYYNCGVILYNMSEWNKNNCWELIYETCMQHHPINIVEQTLINNSLPERLILSLPPKYNYWGHKYNNKKRIVYELSKGGWYTRNEIDNAIDSPVIIHYKDWFCHPWHSDAITTKGELYHEYELKAIGYRHNNDSSIISEISNIRGYSRVKKYFFVYLERINNVNVTKVADVFVEFIQWIKISLKKTFKRR